MSFPYLSYSTYVPPVTYVLPPPPVQVFPVPYTPMYRIQPMPVVHVRPVPTCNPFIPVEKIPDFYEVREALKNVMAPRYVKELGSTVSGLSRSSLAHLKVDETLIFLKNPQLIAACAKFFPLVYNHITVGMGISGMDETYKEKSVNVKILIAAFTSCHHMNSAFSFTGNADENLLVETVRASATKFVDSFEKVCKEILFRCSLGNDLARDFLKSLSKYYYDFQMWRAMDEKRLIPQVKKIMAQMYKEEYLWVKSGAETTLPEYAQIVENIDRLESRFLQLESALYLKEFKGVIYHFLETGEVNEKEAKYIQDLKDMKKFDYPKTSTLGLAVLFGHRDLGDVASYYSSMNVIHIMKRGDVDKPIQEHVALSLKKWRTVRVTNPALGLDPTRIDAFLDLAKGRQFTVICFKPSEDENGINLCGGSQGVEGDDIVRCYEALA